MHKYLPGLSQFGSELSLPRSIMRAGGSFLFVTVPRINFEEFRSYTPPFFSSIFRLGVVIASFATMRVWKWCPLLIFQARVIVFAQATACCSHLTLLAQFLINVLLLLEQVWLSEYATGFLLRRIWQTLGRQLLHQLPLHLSQMAYSA